MDPAERSPVGLRYDIEEDGRWIAEAPSIPGALVYGSTRLQACERLVLLLLELLAAEE